MILDSLYRKLQYTFSNQALLIEALTHRSRHFVNNERLEFLGDSILGFVIAAELYQRFPKAQEGELSRCRAALVKGETLANLAKELDLGEYLLLGPGELKSGGFRRASTLADALEAIIGAIYLDRGYDAARDFILTCYGKRLGEISIDESLKDSKTQLQEYLQSHKLPLPEYTIVTTEGSMHEQIFQVKCRVTNLSEPTYGEGTSRRKAEQASAKHALNLIEEQLGSSGIG